MKKQIKFFLILVLMMISMLQGMNNIENIAAIEKNSDTKLYLEQISNNTELLSNYGELRNYSFYPSPTINSEQLVHGSTRIDLFNIREELVNQNEPYQIQNVTGDINNEAHPLVEEFTSSANTNADYILKLDYEAIPENISSTNNSLTNGTLYSGDLQSINPNNNESILIFNGYESTSYNLIGDRTQLQNIGSNNMLLNLRYNDTTNKIRLIDTGMYVGNLGGGYYVYNLGITFNISNFEAEFIRVKILDSTFPYQIIIYNNLNNEVFNQYIDAGNPYYHDIPYNVSFKSIVIRTFSDWCMDYYDIDAIIDIDTLIAFSSSFSINLNISNIQNEDEILIPSDLFYQINSWNNTINRISIFVNSIEIYSITNPTTYSLNNLSFPYQKQKFIQIVFYAANNIIFVNLESFYLRNNYNPIIQSTLEIDNIEYKILGINYVQNDFSNFSSIDYNQTLVNNLLTGSNTYSFSNNQFSYYNFNHYFMSYNQTFDVFFTCYPGIIINFVNISIISSSIEYLPPTAANFSINNIPIEDESYNTGSLIFTDYPEYLNFTGLFDLKFNFTITSTFTYEFELEIKSYSYLSKILRLSSYHCVNLLLCKYEFEATILHSYLNNVDYFMEKQIYPNFIWTPTKTIKFDVILGDQIYLNLERINFQQVNPSISTKDDSIQFNEMVIANRSFYNWYIENENLVLDVNITQIRTSICPEIFVSNSDYSFSLDESPNENEIYLIQWTFNSSWIISSEIISNDGINITLKIEVISQFDLENVTVYFQNGQFFSNWNNATQNSNTNEIAFFVNKMNQGTNIFYLEGYRDVISANFQSFTSQPNLYLYPNSSQSINYYGFLEYSEYSEVWRIPAPNNWILDGVHYFNKTYLINNNQFVCEGFDSSITSSFLYFSTNPLNEFKITYDFSNLMILLSINLSLPLNDTYIMFPVIINENYKITTQGITKLYDLDGVTWYMMEKPITLDSNLTEIYITFQYYVLKNSIYYSVPILIIGIGGVIWYLYTQRKNDNSRDLKFSQ